MGYPGEEGTLSIEDVEERVLDAQKGCLVEKWNISRPKMDFTGSKTGDRVAWLRTGRCLTSFSADVLDVS